MRRLGFAEKAIHTNIHEQATKRHPLCTHLKRQDFDRVESLKRGEANGVDSSKDKLERQGGVTSSGIRAA